MSVSKDEYSKMTDKASPPSPVLLNCVKAFVFGGGICLFAQLLNFLFMSLGLKENEWKLLTASIIIVITAALTGIGVYDKIARHAGAGCIVPISGFANSVVAPALEFQHEGYVLGTAAQMFSIAGPVIVYGTATSVIYGLIYYLVTK
ncbi:MAG: stage V sporulation protein AC [Eubacterium sp.]|nr:stage V sporulation protein AC [Eubacterium sp.]